MKKPLALIIMDGFGINPDKTGNAIAAARTPSLDRLFASCPSARLGASGMDVGLPDGQMGNSEVGHTNIGAGRVVYQELTRISKSIVDGDFFENPAFSAAVSRCKSSGTALHLAGLLSDGGVHSHNTHLYALLELVKRAGLTEVYVHCYMDGRDVPPSSGAGFIKELEDKLAELGVGKIATVMGRYYAMDRDNRWERVQKAYDAMTAREGVPAATGSDAMANAYAAGQTDEFVVPSVIEGGAPVKKGDSFIFYNFRPDRAREITRAFVDPDFTGFARSTGFLSPHYVCMTQYDASMPGVKVAFTPQILDNTLGAYLSSLGMTQLRIAETEKYAHVTFFFNGGVETVCDGEDRALIPSPKVATYDLQPEMSAPAVTEEVLKRIASGAYDLIVLNYANCDMVGHTGVFDAAVAAVETVDGCVGRVVSAITDIGGVALITADHGNSDRMIDDDGVTPFTAHTTNPVPFIVSGADVKLRDGKLADIAPTIIELLGKPIPAEMTGRSLIVG